MRLAGGLFVVLFCTSARADVCDPARFAGAYAFQLSGNTTIAGPEKPMTSLGRLTFDGTGNVSGTSSAMFTGLLLGNPVTGTYEAHADCTLSWKLQDDSGAFQNFAGTMSPDLARVQFRQTDPGGPQRGTMQKSPDRCTAADLQPRYTYTVSGSVIPMQDGGPSRTVSGRGTLLVTDNPSVQVEDDCTVRFDLLLRAPNDEEQLPMKMRGYLVNGGKEILAIQTDPGAMVSGRFSSDSK
jgi:hypothetical protein